MVHYRLNEQEANPNPHVNFITALPLPQQEEARQLLRALAAQVKPVMKANGFAVNSLEEYEYNNVFAGRNWNNGEVVELVLRRPNGGFAPIAWLLSTLCHELAHIKHMNHGPAFQALWTRLRHDVKALQEKGYYGDGYWSSGTRLGDSETVGGNGLAEGDLPEYMCGGAQTRTRPSRRRRPTAGSSSRPRKRRKAGSRVTAAGAFTGAGHALNADISDEERKNAGAGFRKRAISKRAREERALAAEARIRALQGKASSPSLKEDSVDSGEESDDGEEIPETDLDRRRTMLESMEAADADDLRSGTLVDYWGDIIPPKIEPRGQVKAKSPEAVRSVQRTHQTTLDSLASSASGSSTRVGNVGNAFGLGNLVQEEIRHRKKESLGLTATRADRTLGANPANAARVTETPESSAPAVRSVPGRQELWPCLVCTLDNVPDHLACIACGTPRGETVWLEPNS
ncbi:WLM-domain-containing protein [Artomyces pyxidatus]|uniref:WLM-domain-containing protein n=1 Tax=Artomyces pyxidatus TaxID=48021 RepID=A0ACB8T988_9AGAM|nr:WLM-domain-containing protein [Artomyces pyxidatus]